MRILIIDLTHGGEALAVEYGEKGDEVVCVDCYGTFNHEAREELEKAGIRCLDRTPEEHFDLLVAPIHCPDSFLKGAEFSHRKTFHQAVGDLTKFRGLTIEVTGVRGKTSTCHVISHIMQSFGRTVMQLSSRGIHLLGDEVETIEEEVSISPTSLLRISRIERTFDTRVFEVSLGGTGLADVGIITTLGDNYPIAAGTRTAFDGKRQMLNLARKVVVIPEEERELWEPQIPPGIWITTFGEGGNVNAIVDTPIQLGQEVEVRFKCHPVGEFTATLNGNYLVPIYLRPMAAALAALKSIGIPMPQLCSTLQTFQGVPNRGEIWAEEGRWIIRDRNPGVSAHSIEYQLSMLEEYYGAEDIGLVVEPVSQRVCEPLRLGDLETIFEVHDSVTGAYLLNHGGEEVENFTPIDDINEVKGKHHLLLWCTKEGFL